MTTDVRYDYVAPGVINVKDATGSTSQLKFTSTGQIASVTDALNRVTSFIYDTNDRLIQITAPGNTIYKFTYDAQGRLLSQTDPLNGKVSFTYSGTSNSPVTVTDGKGQVTRYSYSASGDLTGITYTNNSAETFTYDANGRLVQAKERSGDLFKYTYDANGKLSRKTFDDNTYEAYTYDAQGNLTTVRDVKGGITGMVYDSQNRMTKITYADGKFLAYTYDTLGRRTQMKDQSGFTTNYSYDTNGRLQGLKNGAGASIVAYTYDAAGRLTKEANGNGTYTLYTYDAAGQLTAISNRKADHTVNSFAQYTYDALGRQTKAVSGDGSWVYTYDLTGQLTRAQFTSTNASIANQDLQYVYDAAGNRIRTIENGMTKVYATNALNQYTQVGTAVYSYDADGNLTKVVDGAKTWNYTYNDENRLIKAVTPTEIFEYEYDAFGNRTAVVQNGQRTRYVVDPFGLGDVVGEYGGNGVLTANYAHGLGLVGRFNGATANYYDGDLIGSTVGLTGANGSYVNRYAYRPFGEDLLKTEGVANGFEFVGKWGVMDEASGLDYMRARYYSSSNGRFVNPDPIRQTGGINLYSYVINNPANLVDMTGETGTPPSYRYDYVYPVSPITGENMNGTPKKFPDSVLSIEQWKSIDEFYKSLGKKNPHPKPAINSQLIMQQSEKKIERLVAGKTPDQVKDFGIKLLAGLEKKLGKAFVEKFSSKILKRLSLLAAGQWTGPFSVLFDVWATLETLNDIYEIYKILEEIESGSPRSNSYALVAAGNTSRGVFDPLVLDLDGDGIELVSIDQSTAQFDLNADGFREQTGWVKGDDGMLALDANGDGKINNINELFGDAVTDGFDELKTLDSNNDKIINASDAKFSQLKIWRDLNQNGITDIGELKTLTESGVKSISLTTTDANFTNEGNIIRTTGKYTRINGTQSDVVALWFAADRLNTSYDKPYQLKAEALFLPSVRGYAKVPDLHIAVSLDSQLLNLVRGFATLKVQDLGQVSKKIEDIMFRWAKVDAIAPNSRGAFFDARKLAFLEEFLGQPINFTFRSEAQTMFVRQAWDTVFRAISGRLIVQGTMRDLFSNSTYSLNSDSLTNTEPLSTLLTRIRTNAPTDATMAARYWSYAFLGLDAHDDRFKLTEVNYNNQITAILATTNFKNYLAALRNPVFGTSEKNVLYAANAGSLLDGQADNDTLYGSFGNDIINGDDGNDTITRGTGIDKVDGGAGIDTLTIGDFSTETKNLSINDTSNPLISLANGTEIRNIEKITNLLTGSGKDTINFITRTDTSIQTGAGDDIINTGLGTTDDVNGGEGNDQLTIDYSLGDTGSGMQMDFNGSYGSATRNMADTITPLDRIDFSNIERFNIIGTKRDDNITTGAGNDTVKGGAGNDNLSAGAGNDSLDGGAGNDSIAGGSGIDSLDGGSGKDTLTLDLSSRTTALSIVNYLTSGISITGVVRAVNFEAFNIYTGSGNDTVTQSGVVNGLIIRSDDYINTGAGNDTINLGLGTIDNVNGGAGDDQLTIDYSLGDTGSGMQMDFNGSYGSATRNMADTITPLDRIDFGNIERFNIIGTKRDDNIITGAGNDTVKSGAGNDNLSAGAGNDSLDGGAGNDSIFGGSGIDSLDGGSGKDTLTLDLSSQTTALRIANYLTSGISITGVVRAVNFEAFNIYTGSGNDTVTQSGVVNGLIIRSDDYINTGAGNDTINLGLGTIDNVNGGAGDDQLTIDYSLGDTGSGMQMDFNGSYGSATRNMADTITPLDRIDFSNIERFNIIGTSKSDSIITGIGNDTIKGGAGNDTISGWAGNDILDGGIGSDVLDGNVGNDAYTIDNTNDLVIESSTISTEIDVVYSSVNYSLTANVEQLVLTGTANLNGTGNSLNNVIRGNAGNNTLNGGLGADQFQFSNKVSGIDTLGDFTTNVDKIVLSASGFGGGLVAGAALNITQLLKVTTGFAATNTSQRLIYNSTTGGLYFDADGSGAIAAIQFATLSSRPALAATDFLITL